MKRELGTRWTHIMFEGIKGTIRKNKPSFIPMKIWVKNLIGKYQVTEKVSQIWRLIAISKLRAEHKSSKKHLTRERML